MLLYYYLPYSMLKVNSCKMQTFTSFVLFPLLPFALEGWALMDFSMVHFYFYSKLCLMAYSLLAILYFLILDISTTTVYDIHYPYFHPAFQKSKFIIFYFLRWYRLDISSYSLIIMKLSSLFSLSKYFMVDKSNVLIALRKTLITCAWITLHLLNIHLIN